MSRLFAGTTFDKPTPCKSCGKLPADCRCHNLSQKTKMAEKAGGKHNQPTKLDSGLVLTPQNARVPEDQVAKVRLEKRKGNRMATVITGMEHPANDLAAICTELKQKLGVGGSVQGRTVELQGDHTPKVVEYLIGRGLKARAV